MKKRFSNTNLYNYTDSNFVADKDNKWFTSEFLFKLNETCIHWQSKQQSLIACFTHKIKYIDMTVASYEISYLQKLLTDLTVTFLVNLKSIFLYDNNMSAIITAMNSDSDKTSRTHHIDICYHVIWEVLINDTLKLRYIQITDMTVNILTKILSRETHDHHMKTMRLDWQ